MGDGAVAFCTKGLDSIRRFDKIQVLTPPRRLRAPRGLISSKNWYRMKNNERVFTIIDGSNFYHRLKEMELKNLLGFDYSIK